MTEERSTGKDLEGAKKNQEKISVRIPGAPAEIRTENLPSMSSEGYCYDKPLGFMMRVI
jgi:hypothetical protein